MVSDDEEEPVTLREAVLIAVAVVGIVIAAVLVVPRPRGLASSGCFSKTPEEEVGGRAPGESPKHCESICPMMAADGLSDRRPS